MDGLLLSDYHYDLPERLIASRPLERRDDSRMLVLDRASGTWSHRRFSDFPEFFEEGDLAVLNDSKVLRARLPMPGNSGELLLVEPLGDGRWICLARPGSKWRVGMVREIAGTLAHVESILENGERIIAFDAEPDLDRYGEIPLPPYIKRRADAADAIRYQTVYAREEGSVAAPTAGLHFTPAILERVPHAYVTLHVGPGTFRPVKTEKIEEHRMHEERYVLPAAAAAAINNARRVTAVGTTVCRVLESQPEGPLVPVSGRTSIFIHPPYRFRHVDRLLTNFHLPGSTLLMLVSAFAGRELILAAYADAVRKEYRFFSYGDCMLIL
jgi:S-adenosylmethionine:tRNA ribosyltransferase-isomerase